MQTALQLDSGVSVLQRRITELEQALDRCQKRLEIPTVALVAHPEVEAASLKVGKGRKVDLDAVGLGRRVQEDAFLNQVQVNNIHGSIAVVEIEHTHLCPSLYASP